MKTYLLVLSIFLLLSQAAYADEFIQMSNGMTCWKNDAGHIWGCSGGSSNKGDTGFNDVRTGKRYEYINEDQAIDTRTGQPINTPHRKHHNDDNDDK